MTKMTAEEIEEQKKMMYEKFSPRRRKFVDKIGYDEWDPFQLPFDPIDLRQDITGKTSQQLCEEFCREVHASRNSEYAQAAAEFGVMLVMNFEKVRPIFDFCVWYNELLKREGKKA
ncbi:hypothetical protein [Maridesulfovibrio hydrothermalis]|uniref:Uncharacterized protein n=1 Tax=Maridesulfovibrio hydrothermalis AM13 = DSM 14728 TaxID=1121451 RepID=L0RHT6_9BACT|nr:hypothetical protein [Maridesulfovibrio hydrothermalis]CCO25151.1 conserved protein of unknown function [Maridesulfovibrio hydrothermalis AM13 = DSM 14728]